MPECPPSSSASLLKTLACLALVFLLQLAATLPALEAPGTFMDEGMLLIYPELFSQGVLPQRDYESYYPPGNIWLLSGAYALLGTNIHVERSVGLLYQLALVGGFFVLLLRWNRWVAVAGSLLCLFALLPLNIAAFAWLGGIAFALWAVIAASARGRLEYRAAAAGVLAGLALTWRADLGPAVILSLGAYAILSRWSRRAWGCLVLGGGLALLPLLAHVIVVGPRVFIDSIFVMPVMVCNGGRALPLDHSPAYAGQLYTLLLLSAAAALWAGWQVWRRKSGNPVWLAAAMLCVGALPQSLQRIDLPHLSYVTPLAFPLLALALGVLSPQRRWAPFIALVAVCLLVPQTYGAFKRRLAGTAYPERLIFSIQSGDRTFPIAGRSYAAGSQQVVEFLRNSAAPGESVFVGPRDLRFAIGMDTFLYHLLPWLKPASYFLEMNPAAANGANSPLARELQGADWLVLNHFWNGVTEPNDSRIPGPEAPNQVVQSEFVSVLAAPPFEVFHRRPVAATTAR